MFGTSLQRVPLFCCAVFCLLLSSLLLLIVCFCTDRRVGLAHFLFMLISGKPDKKQRDTFAECARHKSCSDLTAGKPQFGRTVLC